jgi:apolipoprotein N-acyltransferase
MAEPGSKIYAAFIEAELKAENDIRTSVNNRAAAALTGATGLMTLALAVFAVLVGTQHAFTGWARVWLVVALACMLGAGGCAVLAGFPWKQELTSTRTLDKMLNDRQNDSEAVARDAVAYCNAVAIQSVRQGTSIKVRLLLVAGTDQTTAHG